MTNQISQLPRKVFITAFQQKDFTSLDKWGETVFVTKGYIPFDDLERVRKNLQSYIDLANQDDYVILNGPSILTGMFSILWFYKFGYINTLAFNTKSNEYKLCVLGIGPKNENSSKET